MALTQKEVNTFISELTNRTGEREAGKMFSTALLNEHRTLQATFWRIMRDTVIPDYAKASFDPRNEGAVIYAEKLSEVSQTHIPYI